MSLPPPASPGDAAGATPETLEERIRARLGLRVPDSARQAIVALLSQHAGRQHTSLTGLVDGLSWLGESASSAHALAEVVTSRHTHFFRDHETLQLICDVLLGMPRAAGERPVMWCAGCASGEEPYTLAILLGERAIEADIIATDISPRALDYARAGRYEAKALRHVPQPLRDRYFAPQADGTVEVAAAIRARIRFEHGELVTSPYPADAPTPDVITCRNLLLYYDDVFAARALSRLAAQLRPGGYLFVAAGDLMVLGATPGFRRRRDLGVGVFQRQDDGAAASASLPKAPLPAPVTPPRNMAAPTPTAAPETPPRSAASAPTAAPETPPRSAASASTAAQQAAAAALAARQAAFSQAASNRAASHRATGPDAGPAKATSTHAPSAPAPTRDELERLLVQATRALDEHDFEMARSRLVSVTERAPNAPEPWLLLGVVARKTGDLDEALAQLRRALFLVPQLWPASLLLAGVWEKRGEVVRARQQYRATLKMLDGIAAAAPRPDEQPASNDPRAPLDRLSRLWRQMPAPEQARQLCMRRLDDA